METSPKAKRGRCRTALQVFEWQIAYHLLDSLQARFVYVFWLIEQRTTWLQGLRANEGGEQ
jgi:hypothetical protein